MQRARIRAWRGDDTSCSDGCEFASMGLGLHLVGAGTWSIALSSKPAGGETTGARGAWSTAHLTGLLDEGLVVRSASLAYSTGS